MVLKLTYLQDGVVTQEGVMDGDELQRLSAQGLISDRIYNIGCYMRPGSTRTLNFNSIRSGFKLRIYRMS